MESSKFEGRTNNPLEEISELKISASEFGEAFKISCQLEFGTMDCDFEDRTYRVGITKADLRLRLKGCEKYGAEKYGETALPTMHETKKLTTTRTAAANASSRLALGDGASAAIDSNIGSNSQISCETTKETQILPVKYRPTNRWEIRTPDIVDKKILLEGTAINSDSLVSISRSTASGNRIEVLAELHVSRSAISVLSTKGNFLGKAFDEYINKDAIVGLIIKRAITREIGSSDSSKTNHTIALNQCEIVEL